MLGKSFSNSMFTWPLGFQEHSVAPFCPRIKHDLSKVGIAVGGGEGHIWWLVWPPSDKDHRGASDRSQEYVMLPE